MARASTFGAGQQALQSTLVEFMNAASHRIFAVESDLGDLRYTRRRSRQQNDLTPRLERSIGGSMIEFLQDLLLFWRQISHIDFTWPSYGSTSLFVICCLAFYNVSRKGFTALFRLG